MRAASSPTQPVPLDEVEPASEIVKRFATGAMSFGSISPRGAHHAGHRHEPHRRQIQHRRGRRGIRALQAAGRTAIRCARRSSRWPRGASASPPNIWSTPTTSRSRWRRAPSPAKAASCPATRSTRTSRAVRHSTPGVGLISPPPHHDIYSIEDLAQLIHDLKNVNPEARISVKLVSEVGVGTVAAGVAKARADHVTISGYRGRHRRLPADLADPCRLALGDRPGRDPADAGAERPARPHRGAGRWRLAHRPRRGDRRAAGRRRVRLRHRAADRRGLHHDAQMPSQHLPGRRRDAGPGAAQALHRHSPST